MLRLVFAVIAAIFVSVPAMAQTCSATSYPYPLQNGYTADATQVMDDFNCAARTVSPSFTGFVGIGTTGAQSPLSVSGQVVIGTPYHGDASLQITSSYGNFGRLTQMSPSTPSASALNLMASTDSSNNDQWFSWGVNNGVWTINHGGVFGQDFTINTSGYVGIGTAASTAMLQVNGWGNCNSGLRTAYMENNGNSFDILQGQDGRLYFCYANGDAAVITTTGAYVQISDGRLKKNIGTLQDANGLAAIAKLRPVTYSFRRDKDETKHYGFIAQEVAQVFPELVTTMMVPAVGDGNEQITDAKGLNYTGLIAPLVKAVQQLKAITDAQQQEINGLKAQVTALTSAR